MINELICSYHINKMALPLKKNKIINKSKKNATNNNKIKYATHLYNHDKYLTNIVSKI